jgi:ribosome recycling factor
MDEDTVKQKMQEVVDLVVADIASIRTGRAAPSLVEDIVVPAYGGQQRLKIVELASITAPDTQSLVIDPWDKSIIGDIRKGIMEANIGLNPSIDGQIIRISLPPLTTEDREKYVKLLSGKLENGRIMVRQVRGEAMKEIKEAFENKDLTEDEKFSQEKRLQELTDLHIDKVDEIGESKKKELLQL